MMIVFFILVVLMTPVIILPRMLTLPEDTVARGGQHAHQRNDPTARTNVGGLQQRRQQQRRWQLQHAARSAVPPSRCT